MNLPVEYAIRHFFPSPAFELIYSEAVANALDAEAAAISIEIDIESYSKPKSLKLVIRDNGVGFTDENFNRFSNLMVTKDVQHKGLGRLVYLQYFTSVAVTSVFCEEKFKKRSFLFEDTIKNEKTTLVEPDNDVYHTELRFGSFKGVQLKSYDYVSPVAIKRQLQELFMPRLFSMKKRGIDFKISISLRTNEEKPEKGFVNGTEELTPDDIVEFDVLEFEVPQLHLLDIDANCKLLYKIETNVTLADHKLVTALCIDGRTFPLKLASDDQLPIGTSAIFMLESSGLNSKTNESRQELALKPDEIEQVSRIFSDKIVEVLNEKIPQVQERNQEIRSSLCDTYPHLSAYFGQKTIGIINRNRAIADAQAAFCKAEKEILEASDLSDAQYEKSLEQASRILTQYILYRNKIIRKMSEMTGKNQEADLHNLIVPQRRSFESQNLARDLYNNNAWLLDDKYMTYQSILSEKQLQELMEKILGEEERSEVNLRPDIAIVFSEDIDKATHPVDVVVVELKREGIDHLKKDAIIEQIRQRARRLVTLYPTKIQRMWFFGVIDFDAEMRISLKEKHWMPLYSKGESYYKELSVLRVDSELKELPGGEVPVAVTLLSQESLWKDALARNETFLSLLKDSIKAHNEQLSAKGTVTPSSQVTNPANGTL